MGRNFYWETVRKAIKVFSFNIAVIVIGVVLYNSNTNIYSKAIVEQTSEWNGYPIKDILEIPVNSTGGCPSGYENLDFSFLGTRTFCPRSFGDHYIGTCRRRSYTYTV